MGDDLYAQELAARALAGGNDADSWNEKHAGRFQSETTNDAFQRSEAQRTVRAGVKAKRKVKLKKFTVALGAIGFCLAYRDGLKGILGALIIGKPLGIVWTSLLLTGSVLRVPAGRGLRGDSSGLGLQT